MKHLRNAISSFADIIGIAPILVAVGGILITFFLSVIAIALRIAEVTITLSLPILMILLILASYPPLKILERYFLSRSGPPFAYNRLHWKRSISPFRRTVMPVCPHCHRPLVIGYVSPKPFVIVDWSRGLPNMNYKFVYDCSEHGRILETETPPARLRELAQNYLEGKTSKQ